MRRVFFSFLGVFFLLSPFLNISGQTSESPNVIFIICDDLNDYEGVFGGHPQAITPNMDKLAASGVQFLNAQSNAPVCQPSRNSIFTGVYPHDSGDFGWTKRTKQAVLMHNKTLMDLFKENGYYMAGTGKLLHGNEMDDWDVWGNNEKHNYGPIYYDGNETVAHPAVPSPHRDIGAIDGSYGSFASAPISVGMKDMPGWVYGHDLTPFRYVNENDRDLLQDELHAKWAVEQFQAFEQANLSKPFFMGIGFVKPHTPLHAPQKYYDMYPMDELELDAWLEGDENDTYYKDNFDANKKGLRYFRTLKESYNDDRELAMKTFLQAYLACVSFVDEQIGKVLDGLENSPYAENTVVVLTSDHGWQMGEKQYVFKNSPWEESARVPLVIRAPGNTVGVVEQPVSLVDIVPTLIDYCSLEGSNKVNELGADLGGNSMVPFLSDPQSDEWTGPEGALTIIGNTGVGTTINQQNFSYRTRDWRYILYKDGSEELYNHVNDPREWHNLAYKSDYIEIKKDLKQQIMEIVPEDQSAFFFDDYESYTPGVDLEESTFYKLWGGSAILTASNDVEGLGPFEGNQFAKINAAWGAMIAPFTLTAGNSYRWTVATKVEIDNQEDHWKRERNVSVKSGEYEYLFERVDSSLNDWVVTETEFTIETGLEVVNLMLTGAKSYPMGIDSFLLEELPSPRLKLYYDGEILEGEEDGEVIYVALQNDTFTEELHADNWHVDSLPEGIGIGSITRIDEDLVHLTLQGNSIHAYEGKDEKGVALMVPASDLKLHDESLSVNGGVVFSAKDTTQSLVRRMHIVKPLRVFPNPARNFFYVGIPENSTGVVELFSMNGNLICKEDCSASYQRIDVPEGVLGVFYLRLTTEEEIYNGKVMLL